MWTNGQRSKKVREERYEQPWTIVLLTAAVLLPVAVYAQPRSGNPTTATVITKAEIDKIGATEQSQRVRDENAKVADIGDGWSMDSRQSLVPVARYTSLARADERADLASADFGSGSHLLSGNFCRK